MADETFTFEIKTEGADQASAEVDRLDRVLSSIEKHSKRVGDSMRDAFEVAGRSARNAQGQFSASEAATRKSATAADHLAQALQREAAVLERIRGPMREHKADLQQLIGLYHRGEIAAHEYTKEVERMNRALGQTPVRAPGKSGGGGIGSGIMQGAGLSALSGGVAGVAAMATQGAVGLVKDITDLGDTYINLDNRMRQVSVSQSHHNALMETTREIADRSRSDWSTTGALFVRMSMATKELGISEGHTLKLTESIGKAFAMSGATASEASAGMLQLSQALASGRLNGDEFRSISENVPIVLDLLSKQLGVTRGELKKLSSEGKITSQVIVDAFTEAGPAIDAGFNKTIPSLSQSFAVFKNEMMATFGPLLADLLPKLGSMLIGIGKTIGGIVSALDAVMKNSPIDKIAGEGATSNALTGGFLGTVSQIADQQGKDGSVGLEHVVPVLGFLPDEGEEAVNLLANINEQFDIMQMAIEKVRRVSTGLRDDDVWSQQMKVSHAFTGDLIADLRILGVTAEGNDVTFKQQAESFALLPMSKVLVQDLGAAFGDLGTDIRNAAKEMGLFVLEAGAGDGGALGVAIQKWREFREARMAADPWIETMDDDPTAKKKKGRGGAKPKAFEAMDNLWGPSPIEMMMFGGSGVQVEDIVENFEVVLTGIKATVDAANLWDDALTDTRSFAEKVRDAWTNAIDRTTEANERMTASWNERMRMAEATMTPWQSGLRALEKQATDVAGATEAAFVNAFSSIEGAIVQMATTWDGSAKELKAIFKQVVQSMLSDLIRLIIKQIIAAALMRAIGGGGGTASIFKGSSATQGFAGLYGSAPGFATGGQWTVRGSGGTDSVMQAFRATPGERVTVETPEQQRKASSGDGGMGGGPRVKVFNYLDRGEILSAFDSADGERIVHNIIRRSGARLGSYLNR